jgi:hypothetical protein
MDKRAILLVGIFLAVLLAGCVQQKTPLVTGQGSGGGPGPTIAATQAIYIKETPQMVDSLGPYSKPPAGKVFLVLSLEIENKGYAKFNTNSFYWKLQSNNIEYPVSSATYSMDGRLELLDVLDGGKVSGKLAFEVPSDTTDYVLGYDSGFQSYNLVRKV